MKAVRSGKTFQAMPVIYEPILSAPSGNNGLAAISSNDDSTASIWDIANGSLKQILSGQHHGNLASADLSSDGSTAITGSGKRAIIWDARSGNPIQKLTCRDLIRTVSIRPDGKMALTLCYFEKQAALWNTTSGEMIMQLSGHEGQLNSAVFSEDGQFILTSSDDGTARIWETATGKQIQIIQGNETGIRHAAFSNNGLLALLVASDGSAGLWEVKTAKKRFMLGGGTDDFRSATFSFDSKKIVAVKSSKVSLPNQDTLQIWSVLEGRLMQAFPDTQGIKSANFSNDGNWIITGSVADGPVCAKIKLDTGFTELSYYHEPDYIKILEGGDITRCLFHHYRDWASGKVLITRLQLPGGDWLVFDEHFRFDGSAGAMEKLKLTSSSRTFEFNSIRDSLFVPDLAGKILKGETILSKKISEL